MGTYSNCWFISVIQVQLRNCDEENTRSAMQKCEWLLSEKAGLPQLLSRPPDWRPPGWTTLLQPNRLMHTFTSFQCFLWDWSPGFQRAPFTHFLDKWATVVSISFYRQPRACFSPLAFHTRGQIQTEMCICCTHLCTDVHICKSNVAQFLTLTTMEGVFPELALIECLVSPLQRCLDLQIYSRRCIICNSVSPVNTFSMCTMFTGCACDRLGFLQRAVGDAKGTLSGLWTFWRWSVERKLLLAALHGCSKTERP